MASRLTLLLLRPTRVERTKVRCSTTPTTSRPEGEVAELTVTAGGQPALTIWLPSRKEKCRFVLRTHADTARSLCAAVRQEDRGVQTCAFYGADGARLAAGTAIGQILLNCATSTDAEKKDGGKARLQLRLNDVYHEVRAHGTLAERMLTEARMQQHGDKIAISALDEMRARISGLYAALCVDDHRLEVEMKLLQRLDELDKELEPLEKQKEEIARSCEKHAERVLWAGFVAMGLQTGLFARLTWYEYSWDIMEPVTYFATYATVAASLAYYLHTRQAFEYATARQRIFTKRFYREAAQVGFDVERYNALHDERETVREELRKIRDHPMTSWYRKAKNNTDHNEKKHC